MVALRSGGFHLNYLPDTPCLLSYQCNPLVANTFSGANHQHTPLWTMSHYGLQSQVALATNRWLLIKPHSSLEEITGIPMQISTQCHHFGCPLSPVLICLKPGTTQPSLNLQGGLFPRRQKKKTTFSLLEVFGFRLYKDEMVQNPRLSLCGAQEHLNKSRFK